MAGTTSKQMASAGEVDAELSHAEQIEQWEVSAGEDFEKNGVPRFLEDIERFQLPVSADEMLHGSISLVLACADFHESHRAKLSGFLARQALNDQKSQETSYRLVFELHSGPVGAVVVDRDLRLLDLAELYDYPIMDNGSLGYMGFWVVRPDGQALSPDEIANLEKAITADIRHDYCDEEVCLDFDESWLGALHCSTRDYCDKDKP